MEQTSFKEKMAHVEFLHEQNKWADMTLPKRGKCIVDEATAIMDKTYFEELGEYSSSLPTGTYIGKRWKRAISSHNGCSSEEREDNRGKKYRVCVGHVEQNNWSMGEYYDIGLKTDIGIKWRKIIVVEETKEGR